MLDSNFTGHTVLKFKFIEMCEKQNVQLMHKAFLDHDCNTKCAFIDPKNIFPKFKRVHQYPILYP